jgi:hypothetical protein
LTVEGEISKLRPASVTVNSGAKNLASSSPESAASRLRITTT